MPFPFHAILTTDSPRPARSPLRSATGTGEPKAAPSRKRVETKEMIEDIVEEIFDRGQGSVEWQRECVIVVCE